MDEPSPGPGGPGEAAGRRSWVRRWHGLELLELFVLCGFVVAQPVLDVTGRAPDFFLFNGAGRRDILLLVATVVLVPPLALWLGETAAGLLGEPARRVVHLALVAGLLAVAALEVAKKLSPVRGAALVAVGLAGGLGAAVLYTRLPSLRLWLRYLTPAPLAFALLFVATSPTSTLVLPHAGRRATPAGAAGTGAPLVMISLDEFPLTSLLDAQGTIDARVFPNFARLAQGSTWYRNATGVSGWTPWAMPAMLTGRYPARIRAPAYQEYPDNLFTLLGKSYDLKVFETISLLCPPKDCHGTSAAAQTGGRSGFEAVVGDSAQLLRRIVSPNDDRSDPTSAFQDQTVREQQGDQASDQAPPTTKWLNPMFRFDQLKLNQPDRFDRFLRSVTPTARPTFYFLHLLLPHAPWRYLPSGARYPYPPGTIGISKPGGQWPNDPWPPLLGRQRHLLQLAYTDRLIGEAMQRLRAQGVYDKALVVVTADHGVSFTPGKFSRKLAGGSAPELAWVPLFVKLPGQRQGRVDDRNWEHVDLVPTITEVLGVRVPWAVDGVSGLGPDKRRRTQKFFYDMPGHRLVVDGPADLPAVRRGATDTVARPRDGTAGLFEVGPYADLVGTRVDQLEAGGDEASARVHGLGAFATADPRRGTLPALVWGHLTSSGDLDGPVGVVVAVNGVVGGGGPAFRDRGVAARFAAMVPDRLFNQGRNQLQLFVVEGTGKGARLHPVALTEE